MDSVENYSSVVLGRLAEVQSQLVGLKIQWTVEVYIALQTPLAGMSIATEVDYLKLVVEAAGCLA